ncbi:MAG: (2Fe-2S) ferredoxin domain-containing protein [Acholeplasmataceae bacterium]|nr:MAG: (2Fe-2S) ferredoxin domain-containing protein [Acholeplasmataceae bacterium]
MTNMTDLKQAIIKAQAHMRRGRRIQIGIGTCGMAAGAGAIHDFFIRQIEAQKLKDVYVTGVGCMGECAFEPLVEVVEQDGSSIIYCKVTPERAEEIFASHILDNVKLETYSLHRFKKAVT